MTTRYSSVEESNKHHREKYRVDGVKKGKGLKFSPDFYRVQFIINEVKEGSVVLDAGCNTGAVSLQLTNKKCRVSAIDIVPELVSMAKQYGLVAKVGRVEQLEFRDNRFDYVVCTEVLEHLFDPELAIKEAHRVLKKGGSYIVTVPHPSGRMAGDKLGDFHHQNFSFKLLDDLLHKYFKKGKVMFVEIPYTEVYCEQENIAKDQPQWIGLVARK